MNQVKVSQNISGPTDLKRHVMNSHNTKQAFTYHRTPRVTNAEKENAKVISTTLVRNSELAIAPDNDGCDPYNSTGQHVVIKSKLQLED
jgi:hypothetical protein